MRVRTLVSFSACKDGRLERITAVDAQAESRP